MAESEFLQSCRESLGAKKSKPFSFTEAALNYLKKKAAEEKAAQKPSTKKVKKLMIVPRPWFVRLIHKASVNWRSINANLHAHGNGRGSSARNVSNAEIRTAGNQSGGVASSGKEGSTDAGQSSTEAPPAPTPTPAPVTKPVAVAVPFSSQPSRVRIVPHDWVDPEVGTVTTQSYHRSSTTNFRDAIVPPPLPKSVAFMKDDCQAFMKKFNTLANVELMWLAKWVSSNGYFDNMLKDNNLIHGLKPGEQSRAIAPDPDNRRIVITGTVWGPVLVFQTNNDLEGSSPIAISGPAELRIFNLLYTKSHLLSAAEIERLIGKDSDPMTDNIGKLSQRIRDGH